MDIQEPQHRRESDRWWASRWFQTLVLAVLIGLSGFGATQLWTARDAVLTIPPTLNAIENQIQSLKEQVGRIDDRLTWMERTRQNERRSDAAREPGTNVN